MVDLKNNVKSVYIHIPFCKKICSYCDFCKIYYNDLIASNYLDELKKEIRKYYKNETINTLYIGGGTPSSLSVPNLNKLFEIINILKKSNDIEFTFECNIEDINENLLTILKNGGVNRLSIGVESFNTKNLNFLNRNHANIDIKRKIDLAKSLGFKNINIDLIYAIPNESFEDLKQDIDNFLKLDITHISTYSLIIEPNTILNNKKVKNIDEELDYKMYEYIKQTLKQNNYIHYEISNFAKVGYESIHNLTYWNNNYYYGFGLGASGYVNDVRYDNTRSITKYLKGEYRKIQNKLSFNEKVENEFILGFRKIKGINIIDFKTKYDINLFDLKIVNKLLQEKKLIYKDNNLFINEEYLYQENNILIEFLGINYEIVKKNKRCYN